MLTKKLLMFIGIPGSGKSTTARRMKDLSYEFADSNIWEADMYFIDSEGNYNWDPSKLGQAHQWCQQQVENDMKQGKNVIVSNTCLTPKERKPYFDLAKKYHYTIQVIVCNGGFQNIHNVPEETIERMKARYIPFDKSELKG